MLVQSTALSPKNSSLKAVRGTVPGWFVQANELPAVWLRWL
jgi:hypothetical protein